MPISPNIPALAVLSASSGSQSWNSDYSYFVLSTNPWASRGGLFSYTANAGLFNSNYSTGGSYTNIGFRTVLSRS